ncbi:MAG: hypothetical protein E7247_12570 [Paenibacillaceae bacterium]|nr:hypothetical protein [Paenibacillaceae bacterium]
MAKCGVTNIGGGGGIGSDEVSATKDEVLSGKTYVGADTGDELGTGTMANNGATENQRLNAGSSFLVKKGYHAQDFSVGASSLGIQTPGNADTSSILSGRSAWVNGNKITGNISYLEGQTINPTASQQTVISSGKYMTGNVIVKGVYNLLASNIKKGVSVGGVVGTFEGYVPTANDLYNRGYNRCIQSGGGSVSFDSGQITLDDRFSSKTWIRSNAPINLTGFNSLRIQFWGAIPDVFPAYFCVVTAPGTYTTDNAIASTTSNVTGLNTFTIDVSAINANRYITFSHFRMLTYVYRIWLE